MSVETAAPTTSVEELHKLKGPDLHDLCDAADAAIVDGGGFGWLEPPARQVMESYWQGVLLIPDRRVFVARLDGVIAGSGQLVRPPRNAEASALSCQMTTFFLAPWARGHGLAVDLLAAIEEAAAKEEFKLLNLDVRETQTRAIQIYEQRGYVRWGTHPHYVFVDGHWLTGYYYYKDLNGGLTSGAARGPRAVPEGSGS